MIDTLVTLDVESYFKRKKPEAYSIRQMTTESYVRDPRWETIGWGVKVNDGPAVWLEHEDFRRWAKTVDWARTAMLAHNTHFDGLVLAHHYGHHPALYMDTISMGYALHGISVGGSLAKMAERYQVGVKGDDTKWAEGKRRVHFTPEEWLKYGAYCCNDVRLTHAILTKMLAGFPEVELRLIDATVRCFTDPTFVIDEDLLQRFMVVERARKMALLRSIAPPATDKRLLATASEEELIEQVRPVLMSNDKLAALLAPLLAEYGEEVPTKVSAPKSKSAGHTVMTYAFAKGDPEMQNLLEHEDDTIRLLAEARIGVKSTINESRTARFLRSGAGGRPVPVYLKYAAAHTFRWGGGDRMNFQNLERVDPKGKKEWAGVLRRALFAPKGQALVVLDSGQIEARVIAWLAEDERLLETFRRNDAITLAYENEVAKREKALGRELTKAEKAECGDEGDFYSDVGSGFFGRKLSKKETPVERQLAKNMILGLGFGMGWAKFAGELLKGMLGSDPVQFREADAAKYGVNVGKFETGGARGQKRNGERVEEMPSRIPYGERLVHCAVAQYFVNLYRENNTPIANLWSSMEEVLESMLIEDADPYPVGPGGCLQIVRHGIVLPNGLTMRYPGLKHSKKEGTGGGYSYLGGVSGKQHKHAYGGLVTENVVQALARIIVAEQILDIWDRAREMGGKIVTMTHDEGVFSCPEKHAEELYGFGQGRMRVGPSWAPGLALNAGGGFGSCYGLIK